MPKKGHKEKIDDALVHITNLKARIDGKIDATKIVEFNETEIEQNRPLYDFMYETNIYVNIQILTKLLNDIKSDDIDFDGTAVEYVVDTIINGLKAADRELENELKTRAWYKKMTNIGDRLEKLLDTLLKLLATNIYNLKYTKEKQIWKKK